MALQISQGPWIRGDFRGRNVTEFIDGVAKGLTAAGWKRVQALPSKNVAIFSRNPNDGDSIQVDSINYTFRTLIEPATPPYTVKVGASIFATLTNLSAAINEEATTPDSMYKEGTVRNPMVKGIDPGSDPNPTTNGITLESRYVGGVGSGSLVSGSSGLLSLLYPSMRGGGYVFQSQLTPQGFQCEVRVGDDGLYSESYPGAQSKATAIQMGGVGFTDPGMVHTMPNIGKELRYRIVAHPFQLFIYVIGISTRIDVNGYGAGGSNYMGGVPFVDPSNLRVTTGIWWDMSNTDGGMSAGPSFRGSIEAGTGSYSSHFNGVTKGIQAAGIGGVRLLPVLGANTYNYGTLWDQGNIWMNGAYSVTDPNIAWGDSYSSWPKVRGKLWDALIFQCGLNLGLVKSMGGYVWENITDNGWRGSLCLIVSRNNTTTPIYNLDDAIYLGMVDPDDHKGFEDFMNKIFGSNWSVTGY